MQYLNPSQATSFKQIVVALLFLASASGAHAQSPDDVDFQIKESLDAHNPAEIIRSMTEEFGVFDQRLSDELRVVGRRFQEAGDHGAALDYLEQSWQIEKMNSGLYSAEQIPLLELIIFSEIELARWDEVNDHYSYLELLYRRVFDSADPQLEIGLQKVSAWHVNALSVTKGSERVKHLRAAYHLFKDRLALAEENLEASNPKFDYLIESIQLTEQQLRINSSRNNSLIWQPSIASSSLVADSF